MAYPAQSLEALSPAQAVVGQETILSAMAARVVLAEVVMLEAWALPELLEPQTQALAEVVVTLDRLAWAHGREAEQAALA